MPYVDSGAVTMTSSVDVAPRPVSCEASAKADAKAREVLQKPAPQPRPLAGRKIKQRAVSPVPYTINRHALSKVQKNRRLQELNRKLSTTLSTKISEEKRRLLEFDKIELPKESLISEDITVGVFLQVLKNNLSRHKCNYDARICGSGATAAIFEKTNPKDISDIDIAYYIKKDDGRQSCSFDTIKECFIDSLYACVDKNKFPKGFDEDRIKIILQEEYLSNYMRSDKDAAKDWMLIGVGDLELRFARNAPANEVDCTAASFQVDLWGDNYYCLDDDEVLATRHYHEGTVMIRNPAVVGLPRILRRLAKPSCRKYNPKRLAEGLQRKYNVQELSDIMRNHLLEDAGDINKKIKNCIKIMTELLAQDESLDSAYLFSNIAETLGKILKIQAETPHDAVINLLKKLYKKKRFDVIEAFVTAADDFGFLEEKALWEQVILTCVRMGNKNIIIKAYEILEKRLPDMPSSKAIVAISAAMIKVGRKKQAVALAKHLDDKAFETYSPPVVAILRARLQQATSAKEIISIARKSELFGKKASRLHAKAINKMKEVRAFEKYDDVVTFHEMLRRADIIKKVRENKRLLYGKIIRGYVSTAEQSAEEAIEALPAPFKEREFFNEKELDGFRDYIVRKWKLATSERSRREIESFSRAVSDAPADSKTTVLKSSVAVQTSPRSKPPLPVVEKTSFEKVKEFCSCEGGADIKELVAMLEIWLGMEKGSQRPSRDQRRDLATAMVRKFISYFSISKPLRKRRWIISPITSWKIRNIRIKENNMAREFYETLPEDFFRNIKTELRGLQYVRKRRGRRDAYLFPITILLLLIVMRKIPFDPVVLKGTQYEAIYPKRFKRQVAIIERNKKAGVKVR